MLETLLGGVFGGLLRLAPEVLKALDRKDERKHELAMLDKEMEAARLRAETAMHQVNAGVEVAQLDALGEALKGQASMARAGGKIASAISALVRPLVTYAFVIGYFLVKLAAYLIAVSQGGEWREVLVSLWEDDDMAILFMLLSFWFAGRAIERHERR